MKKIIKLRKLKPMDKPLLYALLLVVGVGVVMLLSASMYKSAYNSGGNGWAMFERQGKIIIAGMILMWIISRLNIAFFKSKVVEYAFYGFVFALLILVLVIGSDAYGGKRWLGVGSFSFQPSELAKFAGIIIMAGAFARKPQLGQMLYTGDDGLKSYFKKDFWTKEFWPITWRCFLPLDIFFGLIAIEPSLSASLAVGIAMGSIIFLHGTSWRIIVPHLIKYLSAVGVFLMLFPWRVERILVSLGAGTENYQINQSLLAIASGGFLGKGLGNGTQKYLFLPMVENDFIFANIGEELGFLGCFLLIALYVFIIVRCFQIAVRSKNRFGFLYTMSVAILMAFQVIVNVGVAVGLLPVTGMTLPFISAGGSSVIIFFMMMGPILSLSRTIEFKGKNNE